MIVYKACRIKCIIYKASEIVKRVFLQDFERFLLK